MRKLMIVSVLSLLAPVLAILAAAPAAAQDVIYHFEPGPGTADAQGNVFTLPLPPPLPPPPPGAGAMIEQQVGLLAVEPFEMARPITGSPYTADISTDVVQPLADGNRIEHHTTSSIARDGQGRVRRDQQLTAIGPILPQVDGRIITIMDPVARLSYSLDPARKVATRSPLPVIKRLEGGPANVITERRVIAGTARAGAMQPDTVAATPVGGSFFYSTGPMVTGGSNDVHTESLGTSQIEGVPAQGTRTVVTIKAGAIGNQAPIEMVTEQWYSSELGAVVLSRRSDPRFGETTYRLQNIVRAEPSADLFQVPADYKVEAIPEFTKGVFRANPAVK